MEKDSILSSAHASLRYKFFWLVLFACYFAWADENDKLICDDVKSATLHVSDSFASKDDRETSSSFDDRLSLTRGVKSV
jgi:hypothetical protein